jgi:hypothetical protein
MTIKQLFSIKYLKQKDVIFNIFVCLSFLATVFISIITDGALLIYFVPITIFAILIKYLNISKQKLKPLYVIGLLAIMISDVLTFIDFSAYFKWILILVSVYLLSGAFLLKKYLVSFRLKTKLYFSILIGLLLTCYIIYSVLDLIIIYIPENMLVYVIINALSLFLFSIFCALIYITDYYDNRTVLLSAAIFCLFHIGLTPINMFIAFNKTFTVLNIISHLLSIYLFMRFIATTKVIKKEHIKQKYF